MALSSAWYYCNTDICQKGILQGSILSIIISIDLYFERMSSMQALFLFSSTKLSTDFVFTTLFDGDKMYLKGDDSHV